MHRPGAQCRHSLLRLPQKPGAVIAVLQIKGHAAQSFLFLQQVIIHIVPVLVVVFQKLLKVPFVVNHQPADPLIFQRHAQLIQRSRHRIRMYLQPVHRSVPTKKMPMVSGPVWLPITGPIKLM